MSSLFSTILAHKIPALIIGGAILFGGGIAIGAAAGSHHQGARSIGPNRGLHGGRAGQRAGKHTAQGLSGVVKSVNGGTIVVTTVNGDWTVTTDESTTFRSGRNDIALQDIQAGDRIRVAGKKDTAAKTITARSIMKIINRTSAAPAATPTTPPASVT